ncbi:pantetheine-phosphate adenylyltransferase [Engelhardtia mirabilis]|uniref:Phosphopantetheine adenylyltransferase n=1 Tax=Engelhardtia mirabilis TaxID=2528011 RepID=A0A518BI15_9BACT|nr:Phosphopantetheine adenylyltransferase [Planctomycetes bacterium Pla133]QDV00931.1 Phosphopantetheine adenylyltransferase [Planctomycetes bacterium Pla86]
MADATDRPSHALFPGTFDPPTFGHLDLIRRGLALFDRVTVAVAAHPSKHASLTAEERIALLEAITADLEGVVVTRIEGLVVDAAEQLGCSQILRGVRSGTDFDYEVTMARTNRELLPRIDTVLLVPDAPYAHITSTLVRQIAGLGGSVRAFVPAAVAEVLEARRPGA